jgi:hypothetical protein
MFKPIIHNLTRADEGFEKIVVYNQLVHSKKSWVRGQTLAEKIINERNWKKACQDALNEIKTQRTRK